MCLKRQRFKLKVLEDVLKVLKLNVLKVMLKVLKLNVLKVVLKVLKVCVQGSEGSDQGTGGCTLYNESSEWWAIDVMGAEDHELYAVLCIALYALLYSRDRVR